jgi:hypothetical protein
MPEPVKTLILRAVRNAIDALDVVGQVVRNPATPPQRETAIYPVVFVFDEPESKVQRNRYAINVMPLHIEVWFRADVEDASDKADLIDTEIYKALLGDVAIRRLVMDIRPEEAGSTDKQWVDEFLGVIVLRWVVKYGHKWEDPTDPQKP